MRYIVIARDQHGAPRVWGSANTITLATSRCHEEAREYLLSRPDLTLRLFLRDRHTTDDDIDLHTTIGAQADDLGREPMADTLDY